MYQRHALPLTTLMILPRDATLNPLSWVEKMNTDKKEHNPFDSKFKPQTTTTIIPKDFDDPCDLPCHITFNSAREEKSFVESVIDVAAKSIFEKNPDILPNVNLIGSLWHRGFVNVLFDRNHCSYIQTVREWINLIGNKFDPNIITNLGVAGTTGIYVKKFYTDDVKRLCEYCHQMFGVDKYEVAKLFATRNPDEFDIVNGRKSTRAHNLSLVAAVYAERGNVESARKYYQDAITVLNGKNWPVSEEQTAVRFPHWQCNFIDKLEKFETYVNKYGTSILSSDY